MHGIYDVEISPDYLSKSSCIGKLYECINAIKHIVPAPKIRLGRRSRRVIDWKVEVLEGLNNIYHVKKNEIIYLLYLMLSFAIIARFL